MIDPVDLLNFAEQHFCKNCTVNPCQIFTSGEYEKCPSLVSEYEKCTKEHHDFLKKVQVPFTPGKCAICREEEMNDRDNEYQIITIRYPDGKIKFRGYACRYHREKLQGVTA